MDNIATFSSVLYFVQLTTNLIRRQTKIYVISNASNYILIISFIGLNFTKYNYM